jgi:hypothetical protein
VRRLGTIDCGHVARSGRTGDSCRETASPVRVRPDEPGGALGGSWGRKETRMTIFFATIAIVAALLVVLIVSRNRRRDV